MSAAGPSRSPLRKSLPEESGSVTPCAVPYSAPARPMGPLRRVRRGLLRMLVTLGCYPHISLNRMPFKTYEFYELIGLSGLKSTDDVLDLGCGTGAQTLIVGRKCRHVTGVDTSEPFIQEARRMASHFRGMIDADFLATRVEEAGFVSETFDKVLSFCVIEHIPNHDEVLRELHRVLKPGGRMILSADSLETIEDPSLIAKHRAENYIARYFREDTLRESLSQAGFRDIKIHAIFRSRYARRQFERGIRKEFRYGYWGAWLSYLRLCLHERLSRSPRGIFLIATCAK